MDYVSEEAAAAGEHAADYVAGKGTESSSEAIQIIPTGGVRYTVPESVHTDKMADKLTVRSEWALSLKTVILQHILTTNRYQDANVR